MEIWHWKYDIIDKYKNLKKKHWKYDIDYRQI